MKNWLKVLLFCLTSLLFIGCDRITKNLAKEHLMFHAPISYLHNTVTLGVCRKYRCRVKPGRSVIQAG